MKNTFIVVLITAKDKDEAKKVARGLLQKKLIACANIIEGVTSLFWWEGKIDESGEVLLILKSQQSKFKEIVNETKKLHSYSVPEIISLPIVQGNIDYLNWIKQSIGKN